MPPSSPRPRFRPFTLVLALALSLLFGAPGAAGASSAPGRLGAPGPALLGALGEAWAYLLGVWHGIAWAPISASPARPAGGSTPGGPQPDTGCSIDPSGSNCHG